MDCINNMTAVVAFATRVYMLARRMFPRRRDTRPYFVADYHMLNPNWVTMDCLFHDTLSEAKAWLHT